MDLNDGTYISQVQAGSELEALYTWAKELDYRNISNIGLRIKQSIIEELVKNEEIYNIALNDLKNVWCTSINVKGRQLLINIVKTKA